MDTSRHLLRPANQARDARDYKTAARLYKEYLAANPGNARIQVQCGHMLKELGIFHEAGEHYLAAAALTPDDADLQVQLGHYYKVTDRLDEALVAYRRATELNPGDEDARHQLAAALHMQAAPDCFHASPRNTLLARAKLNSPPAEFLRNVPVDQFDATLAGIAESRRYYLLEAVEQRFPDPALSEESAVACIGLCLEADAADVALRIVDSLLHINPAMQVPLSLARRCLVARAATMAAAVQAPLAIQLTALSVATNLLTRQRAIIDRLAPTP